MTKTVPSRKKTKPANVPTVVALARQLQVGTRTVYHWLDRGCPRNADGSFDLEAVEAWARENARAGADSQSLRNRLLAGKARLVELEVGERSGELIEVGLVTGLVEKFIATAVTQLRQLPDEMVSLVPEGVDRKPLLDAARARVMLACDAIAGTLDAWARVYEADGDPFDGDTEESAAT